MVPPDRSIPSFSFSSGGQMASSPTRVKIPIKAKFRPKFFMAVPWNPGPSARFVETEARATLSLNLNQKLSAGTCSTSGGKFFLARSRETGNSGRFLHPCSSLKRGQRPARIWSVVRSCQSAVADDDVAADFSRSLSLSGSPSTRATLALVTAIFTPLSSSTRSVTRSLSRSTDTTVP